MLKLYSGDLAAVETVSGCHIPTINKHGRQRCFGLKNSITKTAVETTRSKNLPSLLCRCLTMFNDWCTQMVEFTEEQNGTRNFQQHLNKGWEVEVCAAWTLPQASVVVLFFWCSLSRCTDVCGVEAKVVYSWVCICMCICQLFGIVFRDSTSCTIGAKTSPEKDCEPWPHHGTWSS